MDLWAHFNGVKLDFSRLGKPMDNAVIESFNGRLRDECLNQHWFLSLDEARAVTEAWKEDYNRVRPHRALGNRTASEFARPVSGYAQIPAAHGQCLCWTQVGRGVNPSPQRKQENTRRMRIRAEQDWSWKVGGGTNFAQRDAGLSWPHDCRRLSNRL